MVPLARSITLALVDVRCTILSPLTDMVARIGSRACLLNAPTTFIMLIIMPPVMVLVSWYVKSANRLDPASVMIPAMVTNLLNTDKFLLRLYRTARRHAVQSVFERRVLWKISRFGRPRNLS